MTVGNGFLPPARGAPPQPPSQRGGPLAVLVGVALAFTVAYLLIWLSHGLGTCEEDSDLDAAELRDLCGDGGFGGAIDLRMSILGVVAAGVLAGAAIGIWQRRSRWVVVGAAGGTYALLLVLSLAAGS